jgi:hypothetical protein
LAIVLAKFVHRAIWSAEEFVSFKQRVPVINEWMNECLAEHPSCLLSKTDFLPTRLLDVGEGLGSKLRLVESVDIPKIPGNYPEFMALSHCWGKSRPFLVLSSSSIKILSDGVELDQLPRTFKDAARIVQMLGRRYLWIDSLCIKQDSSVDWQKEAAQMDSIYRNAHLTLAAASSTDSNGGCYIDDNLATMILKFPIRQPDGTMGECKLRTNDRPEIFTSSPLHRRGWVLQESILSRRIVSFTEDQMVWQCRTKHYTEDAMPAPRRHRWEYPDNYTNNLVSDRDRRDMWWSWVENYTKRILSNPNDKLPAFAGITKFFAQETGYTPFAGLWKEHLLSDLLWWVAEPEDNLPAANTPWGTPSWSWSAVLDRFIRQPQSMIYLDEHFSIEGSKYGTSEVPPKIARLVSQELIWTAEPLTSTILRARITLRGPVRDLKNHLHLSPPAGWGAFKFVSSASKVCGVKHHFKQDGLSHIGSDWQSLDTVKEMDHAQACTLTDQQGHSQVRLDRKLDPKTPIYGLYMKIDSGKYVQEKILIITPVANTRNEYRRIGVADHEHEITRFFDGDNDELYKALQTKDAKVNLLAHFAMPCSDGAEERVIELV